MAYEIYKATKQVYNAPHVEFKDELQALSLDMFDNASDIYTVLKENPNTLEYEELEVRVTKGASATKSLTNAYIFDDFKKIIFKDFDEEIYLGDRFKFSDFTWITVNTSSLNSVTASCVVRRSNAKLKFFDLKTHEYHEVECVASDKLVNLDMNTYIILPSNELEVIVKYNETSRLIQLLQRFLINGYPWRVESVDGVTNVKNNKGFIKMKFKYDVLSSYDDLENGIADGLKPENLSNYAVNIINSSPLSLQVGNSTQLNVLTTKNGVEASESVIYESSNEDIIAVNNSGEITAIDEGNAVVTVKLVRNENIFDSIDIEATSVPILDNWSIKIEGSSTIRKSVDVKIYTANVYNNGILDDSKSVTWTWDDKKLSRQSNTINTITFKSIVDSGETVISAKLDINNSIIETKTITLKTPF